MWTKEEQKYHRRLWIDALRSGEYKQCIGTLKNDDGYCCLGVACDVAGKNGLDVEFKGNSLYVNGLFCLTSVLPNEVREWLGFDTNDGTINYTVNLPHLNDKPKGLNFSQIADFIEEHEYILTKSDDNISA